MRMSDYNGKSACQQFEDTITEAIDSVPDELTLCEMIGILELQLHILKNRFTKPKSNEE
jgi:hypothetical protein